MFCPKCGAQLEDGSKFCTMCGVAIEYDKIVKMKRFSPRIAIIGAGGIVMIGILIWIVSVIVNKPKEAPSYHSTYQEESYDDEQYYEDKYEDQEPVYEKQNEEDVVVETPANNPDENLDWIEDRYRLEDFLYTSFDESKLYMFGELISVAEDEFLMGTSYEFKYGSIGVSSDGKIVSIVAEENIQGIAMVMNLSIHTSEEDIFLNLGNEYSTEEKDENGNDVYGYYSQDGTFFVKFYIDKNGQCVKVHVFDPYL